MNYQLKVKTCILIFSEVWIFIHNVFMFNLIYYNNPIYVGIVPIDFPNYNLINAIIKVNF
jgi:hypothetical protein